MSTAHVVGIVLAVQAIEVLLLVGLSQLRGGQDEPAPLEPTTYQPRERQP